MTRVNHVKASKDKKRAREARKAAKAAKDGEDDKDDDDSDGEPQMSETNGNTCFLKGSNLISRHKIWHFVTTNDCMSNLYKILPRVVFEADLI